LTVNPEVEVLTRRTIAAYYGARCTRVTSPTLSVRLAVYTFSFSSDRQLWLIQAKSTAACRLTGSAHVEYCWSLACAGQSPQNSPQASV